MVTWEKLVIVETLVQEIQCHKMPLCFSTFVMLLLPNFIQFWPVVFFYHSNKTYFTLLKCAQFPFAMVYITSTNSQHLHPWILDPNFSLGEYYNTIIPRTHLTTFATQAASAHQSPDPQQRLGAMPFFFVFSAITRDFVDLLLRGNAALFVVIWLGPHQRGRRPSWICRWIRRCCSL